MWWPGLRWGVFLKSADHEYIRITVWGLIYFCRFAAKKCPSICRRLWAGLVITGSSPGWNGLTTNMSEGKTKDWQPHVQGLPRDSWITSMICAQVADNVEECGHDRKSCVGEQRGADGETQHPTLRSKAGSWVSGYSKLLSGQEIQIILALCDTVQKC